jgi:hypothetical protein
MICAQTRFAFVAWKTGSHFALTRPFGSGSCFKDYPIVILRSLVAYVDFPPHIAPYAFIAADAAT